MASFTRETIDFSTLNEAEITTKIRELKISLTPAEILKIQNEILKRPPSLAECILWSIQGSEHCSYKSSRTHLKQFVTSGPTVMLGPGEDAGIVEIAKDNDGHRYGIVVSHESHNHPSQLVPYEGAATGVGGNVRDVACMGAKVIGSADSLRFGDIKKNKIKWIHDGVVSGIAGYGNPIGVPIVAGDTYYDEGYNENCLVNVVTIGSIREDEIIHSRAPDHADGYDLILVGKATDNSGFGGASFASLELDEKQKASNKGAVQEPNAFLKRHLLKATYTLVQKLKEKGLVDKVGFKDLGAGGIACASVELADHGGYGAQIDLDLVPKGMDGLHAAVYLCSETQERFMWVAAPDVTPIILEHYNKTFALSQIAHKAGATVIGKIQADGIYRVLSNGEEIVHAQAADVTSGLLYNRSAKKPERSFTEPNIPLCQPADTILHLLAHENIASRTPIFEHYDKQVQGITIAEPEESDAGVMQPFMDEKFPAEVRNVGIVLKVDNNPRYGKIDPYWGGVNAVIESMRNVAAVGAEPIALTDCLNFGNPEKPEQMWEFVEGTRGVAEAAKNIHLKKYPGHCVPIISGNVSLYNESAGVAIPPSPIISCLGRLEDAKKTVTMAFKMPDSIIILIGERKDECGGSAYYSLFGELGANVPKPDFKEVEKQIFAITDAAAAGLILACHDISDGGVAVALAEMSFSNEIGFEVKMPGDLPTEKKLFTETGGFILEVSPENFEEVFQTFKKYDLEIFQLGRTVGGKKLIFLTGIEIDLRQAKEAWTNGLREKL